MGSVSVIVKPGAYPPVACPKTGVEGWLRLGPLPEMPVLTESAPVLARVARGDLPPSTVTVALSPAVGVRPPAASAGVIAFTAGVARWRAELTSPG